MRQDPAPDPPRNERRSRSTRGGAAAPALDTMLSYRLHLLHKLTDLESQRAYAAEAGLSLADGRCLAAIGAFEPLSVNELAQRANLTKGQASRAAQWLVEQALVDKSVSQADSRGVVLKLTPAGKTAWRRTMALIERRNEAIFGALSPHERDQLRGLLDRLIATAQAGSGPAAAARP